MKILILARFADRLGGADVYTEDLAIGLAGRGHAVNLYCHGASDKVRRRCEVTEIDDPDFSHLTAIWRLSPLLYRRHWNRFLACHRENQPDIIISSLPLIASDLPKHFPGIPWVYLPHSRIAPIEATSQLSDSMLQRKICAQMYARGERWALMNANATVRFTVGNEHELRSYYRLPKSAAFEIIPAAVKSHGERRERQPHDPINLVAVGRLVESKNLDWLLRQLASLETNSWNLHVIGDGSERVKLKLLTSELSINHQVEFHGFCSDVERFYQQADLHVFPSLRESFGLVILEAMAFGVPTLALDPDGVDVQTASNEIIEHGLNGWLVNGKAGFRKQLASCIENPRQLMEFGEIGRQNVLQQHLWDDVAKRWESVLARILEPAGSLLNEARPLLGKQHNTVETVRANN